MKKRNIFKGIIAASMLVVLAGSCESYTEDIITELNANREFSPTGLKATVRNETSVELVWDTKETDDHYVVEFSANDAEFNTIFKTLEVNASELPIRVKLEGETLYSIRVKAVSNRGKEDSTWSVITAQTLEEQIFLAAQADDILGKEATVRWISNSSVTKIVFTPADETKPTVTHTITAQEKLNGVATVVGLSSLTKYVADIFNITSRRGSQTITTGIDLSDGTEVGPTDDLATIIANAAAEAVLILKPGDYTAQVSTIVLNKPITIRGLRSFDKPKLKLSFSLAPFTTGVTGNINLIDLDLVGSPASASNKIDVIRYSATANYSKLLISGCSIHDYERTFIGAGTGINANIQSIIVENSIITNVGTAGSGSFIDFRAAFADEIIFRKSTFNNCVPNAAFIRSDNATVFGSVTTDVLIENCTLYGVTNTVATSGLQIMYVRFTTNQVTVKNSIFAATVARFSNQSTTDLDPTFENNNYFNAPALNDPAAIAPLKSDGLGTALDPQFVNAATGDFTIKNQVLIDRKVGDPRWIK
ncbi:DUF5123 domain-containing protein [Flavobacterium salmonis]|uniref:Fibronectin type-III domain-containing protein n=1 Tax=Flavobacterium salmonis TaxID=2654844 RepID=A0A6V6Z073_9FLAO|nr:DUF5123 domain-containing protein [Flavobacterium salmonis]CAD0004979.1 hypothetical protein FLAT13_02500 [Flavobacterium salmonis]